MGVIYIASTPRMEVSGAPQDYLQLVNGSTSNINILEVYACNNPSAALAGQSFTFELYRLSASAAGSNANVAEFDLSRGSLPASILVQHNANFTVSGNPLAAGNLYTEEGANFMDKALAYKYNYMSKEKPITLRTGEMVGLTGNVRNSPGQAKFFIIFELS